MNYNQLFNVYLSKRIKKTIIFYFLLKICIQYNRIAIENSKTIKNDFNVNK